MNSDITIPRQRHNQLLEAERLLTALQAAGVDNWDGYEMALEFLEDDSD